MTKMIPLILLALVASCGQKDLLLRPSMKANYPSDTTGGIYKIGTPYQVNNTWYYPREEENYREVGIASWYGPDFHQGVTANGEKYDMYDMTAAHRTLPLPCIARVTNLENGKTVIVRVNDRGPFVNNRIIDVSKTAAEVLGFIDQGTAKVRVEVLADESADLKKQILESGGRIVGGPPISEIQTTQKTAVPADKSIFGVSEKGFFVQVGAFAKFENAEGLKTQLAAFGDVKITEKQTNGTVLFRVRLGSFNNPDEAVDVMDKLKQAGFVEARLIEEK